MKSPISSNTARVKAMGNQNVSFMAYEIPEGVFRGALWPSPNNVNFQLWIINGDKEKFYNVPAPSGFSQYEKETTEDWDFKLLKATEAKKVFVAQKEDSNKAIQIELPLKKRQYSFRVLKNSQGDELVIFMDISESIRDEGLFGYAVIRNDE